MKILYAILILIITGDDPNGTEANVTARNQSWERIKEILQDI